MKSKEKLLGFLGAQGCRTGLLDSDDALVETANKLYGITSLTVDEAVSDISRMTKDGRRQAARHGCAKHWPKVCELFPKAPWRDGGRNRDRAPIAVVNEPSRGRRG